MDINKGPHIIANLCVCVLTYNESIHLARCIKNIHSLTKNILVVDSYSTDDTKKIALGSNVEFVENEFINYGQQRKFAIDHASKLGYSWMLFVDADEFLTPELKVEISGLTDNGNTDGYIIKRRFIWRGVWIKRGGYYPTKILRLFRIKAARVTRPINEHVVVKGRVRQLKYDLVDENLNDIDFWVKKHNTYSTMESLDWHFAKFAELKKSIRYFRMMPLMFQPFLYFIYRVLIRGGYRDGINAIWYHYLHSFIMVGLTAYKYRELPKNRENEGNL